VAVSLLNMRSGSKDLIFKYGNKHKGPDYYKRTIFYYCDQ